MARYVSLSHLLVDGRAPQDTVATGLDGAPLQWNAWTGQISALQQQLAEHERNGGKAGAWGVYCEDTANAGAALFALWQSGHVAWMPGNATAETVSAIDREVVGWISDVQIGTQHPILSPVVTLESASAASSPNQINTAWQPLSSDAVLLYVFTSGSTGEPKAIPKKLSQLQAEIDNLQALWGGQTSSTRMMASVTHQHVYGLLFRLLWPLCSGTVFTRETIQYPEQWFALTRQLEQVTWIASPALYKRMQALLPWAELQAHVANLFCSGGPLPEENAAFLATQLQKPVIEVFGSSETGGIGWRAATAPNKAWTPFKGIHLSTSDDGALLVQSPYLPDNTHYEMGDQAEILADEAFILKGRLDRIVKIEEKRVSLPQLEGHLAQHPWVKEAHLLPLTSALGRQSLGAVVVLREDFPAFTAATRKHLTDTLRQHMAQLCEAVITPKKWRFVAEMPLNAQGKRTNALLLPLFAQDARIMLPEILVKESVSAHEIRFVLSVPSKLAYFEGHFRKAPILPGVVQVDWAMQLGQSCWALPDAFSDLEVLKFQRVVTPLQLLQLSLRYDAGKQKLYFQLQSSKGTHASGRIVFKSATQAGREEA